jgi:hypothetical protein
MGRADIAILSEISFGIRLCLHPPALSKEGSAYDGSGLSWPDDFCPTASERGESYGDPGHLIAPHFCALSRYGVIREDRFYLLMENHNSGPHRPALCRTAFPLVAPV